ncbi:DUF2141 domain-containing protein [Flavobacteriaceae bacterium TP-CH-4]|uniref:DUF2141 domain-containing protein n=1 Tax=Pelagihabitans pacificus TaxID=2696054 RepID=A0A967ASB5_9FLAO|nr:DUF2141 domain-containing protein [Pelagihabitans pacificus]NHF59459.1 DUF2141 domain-containing protein [Pelagihabitans pacificus]
MQQLVFIILALFLNHLVNAQQQGVTIEVVINNIENEEGQMVIGLYNSKANWLKKVHKVTFGQIVDGKSTVAFKNVPNGIYAVSVFHDEDNDGELDTFLGIPTEDTGSSNNAPARFGPPKWQDAKFELKGESVKQIIKL